MLRLGAWRAPSASHFSRSSHQSSPEGTVMVRTFNALVGAAAGILASAGVCQAVITLTPGPGATNVASAGLDVYSGAVEQQSIAPDFGGRPILDNSEWVALVTA